MMKNAKVSHMYAYVLFCAIMGSIVAYYSVQFYHDMSGQGAFLAIDALLLPYMIMLYHCVMVVRAHKLRLQVLPALPLDTADHGEPLVIATPKIYTNFQEAKNYSNYAFVYVVILLLLSCIAAVWMPEDIGRIGLALLLVVPAWLCRRYPAWPPLAEPMRGKELTLTPQGLECSLLLCDGWVLDYLRRRQQSSLRLTYNDIERLKVQSWNEDGAIKGPESSYAYTSWYIFELKQPLGRWFGMKIRKVRIRRDMFEGHEQQIIDYLQRHAPFPIQVNDTLR